MFGSFQVGVVLLYGVEGDTADGTSVSAPQTCGHRQTWLAALHISHLPESKHIHKLRAREQEDFSAPRQPHTIGS